LIAAYLASAMDWAIDAAIHSFAQMRPHGIYKQFYLDELVKRYGDSDDRIQANPKDIVAVHCTHGFNRTGFLIAAYLASAMDWAIDAAIHSFAQMRPHGIYKQFYLDELVKRYGDSDDRIQAPPRPAWENGPLLGVDNGINGGGGQTSTSKLGVQNGEPKFMDGAVTGVVYVSDLTTRGFLQNKIREMCGCKRNGFPGSQPVSMERSPERDNLCFLEKNEYMVSWKADGVR
uniref:TYR_PHOSPHATASE_2 domain-containing protein n=1 Tax=Gongylonema pulchrum TaxID=637853 RepID=A0A183ESG6_9BILA